MRNHDAGERLAGEAPAGRVQPLILDVTDFQQIGSGRARVSELAGGGESSPGRLDALVNNAGIGFGGPLELIHPDDLRKQFDVNVLGQIAVTQALLPALRAAHGRIVFLSSVGGRVAMAFTAPYAASKHAIEAIGDALRVELATSNVQVALIEPGSVATPIWDKARETGDQLTVPPELQQAVRARARGDGQDAAGHRQARRRRPSRSRRRSSGAHRAAHEGRATSSAATRAR